MAVDLEAIARRGRCDASSLKLALPLIEQGYEAPFLARYRRDELGGLDEATLWNLKAAVDAEKSLADYRDELHELWLSTPLADPAIGDAIRKSGSNRTLQRLGKRLRQETAAGIDTDANRLAVRMLNPQKGDPSDPAAVAETLESISDAAAAVEGLPKAIPGRLAGDPRVISAAVRWLSRNAKLHISDVHDPHIAAAENEQAQAAKAAKADAKAAKAEARAAKASEAAEESSAEAAAPTTDAAEAATTQTPGEQTPGEQTPGEQTPAPEAATRQAETPAPAEASPAEAADAGSAEPSTEAESPAAEPEAAAAAEAVSETSESADGNAQSSQGEPAQADGEPPVPAEASAPAEASPPAESDLPGFKPDPDEKPAGKKSKAKASTPKKQKKISPRQRRRRWLVSVLKPLEGKRMPATKLSAFQVVMLGRALRSQVAVCAFEYDAAKLVGEIKRAVVALNPGLESTLGDVVMQHEADIREAAEAAWWDELHERASARLVSVVADHLRRQVNRGPVEAKVVMSIDAVGPKTAATAIVSSDGRVLHGEDLPCQLSGSVRGQTVAKMGELIHHYHVDLVVVSNGPARRACLIALGDLIAQSPDHSVRWTVADRSGADTYASSDVANSEMRSTPRRFRAAAWIAFSVLHPPQAHAKVDPLRLRLASFQSELSEDALSISLGHIMSSGASRGGVDSNAAPLGWLQQLPGMNPDVACSLITRREQNLLRSRQELLELDGWESVVQTRQAIPFLRVFESDEVLDGTLIHPDDYGLAKKLATALEIELPPPAPPGYEAPSYEKLADLAEPKLVDATQPKQPAPVEDFDHAGEKAGEFKIGDDTESSDPAVATESDESPAAETAAENVSEIASAEQVADAEPDAAASDSTSADEADAVQNSEGQDAESKTPDGEVAATAESTSPGPENSSPEPIKRPVPERAKIDKCIKEWQVGRHRVNQLVGWLCDPFGETAISNDPPGVLDTMPTLKTLKPGDQVVGVVVGVMSFGVFVELAPDCSGLIHVSRLSDGYVEDLNEAIQVGDVVTAWVTGIDEKRRRVGLSALSPQQEERLEKERHNREAGGGRGGYRRDARSGGGQGRQGAGRSGGGQGQRSGQPQPAAQGAGTARGDQPAGGRGGQGRGGQGRGGQGRGGQGRGGQGRGGQGRGGRGAQGGRGGRDSRKPRQPESYRVVAKPEAKPLTDAMQKGDEPLRSFGDLLQFYSKQEDTPAAKESKPKSDAAKSDTAKPDTTKTETAATESAKPVEQVPAATPPAPVQAAVGGEAGQRDSSGQAAGPSDAGAEKPAEASE